MNLKDSDSKQFSFGFSSSWAMIKVWKIRFCWCDLPSPWQVSKTWTIAREWSWSRSDEGQYADDTRLLLSDADDTWLLFSEEFRVKRVWVKRKWTPYGQRLVFSSSTLLSQGSFFIKPSSSCHNQTPKILQPTDINKIASHYQPTSQSSPKIYTFCLFKVCKKFYLSFLQKSTGSNK